MAEGGKLLDMEFSDSEDNDPLTPAKQGTGKSLKRVPASEDISSDDDLSFRDKPPSKKPSNHSPPPLNPAILPLTLRSPSSSSSGLCAPRVKVYPDNGIEAGPWVVFFRSKPNGKSLNVVQIMTDLGRYSSVSEIAKVRPNKLRVVVADRKHANAIVSDQHFTLEYRVYVPSRDVEIEGVVTEASLTCEIIKREGFGMFKKLPSKMVNILDCCQLGAVSSAQGKKVFTPSDSFRVTFSGSALPDYVVIDKLRLPVRLFVPKPMTCDNCKSLGHTAAYCSNKARCSTCGECHVSEPCKALDPKCPYCGGTPHELSACDAYRTSRDKLKRSLKERSKRSFAEILKSASPPIQQHHSINSNNVFSALSDDEVVADSANASTSFVLKGKPRRKNVTTSKVQGQVPPVKLSVNLASNSSATEEQDQVPPGFRGIGSSLNNPTLEGTLKPPIAPLSPSVPTPQTGFLKFSDIVDGIFTFFNVPDSIRIIVTAILPIVKTYLQQLMQTWPLLALFVSLDD